MLKVSIIIPAYNCQNFIIDTLESIFRQTFNDYEVIVVDDGSTDKTADILKNYAGRINYFYQANGGPSKAKNTGINHAKGKYIAFLDHDDVWLPEKLEKQIPLLDKNSNVGLVFADMYLLETNAFAYPTVKSTRFFQKGKPYRGNIFFDLLQHNFIATSSVVVRKECFEKIGMFIVPLPPVEDYNRWLHIARHYEVDYIDEPLVKYRLHPSCFSNDSILVTKKTIEALSEVFAAYQIPLGLKNTRLADLYYRLGKWYFLQTDLNEARKCLSNALKFRYSLKTLLLFILTFIGSRNLRNIRKLYRLAKPGLVN